MSEDNYVEHNPGSSTDQGTECDAVARNDWGAAEAEHQDERVAG
jgi:hypothetical protein